MFRNEEKTNTVENCGIAEGKTLEDKRESTGGEVADRWASWPHMSSSHGDFSHVGF